MAAYASSTHPDDPLTRLELGELPAPKGPGDWVRVQVRAASINHHHDISSLRGAGLPDERLPMILGCDAAGVTEDGAEFIVHAS